MSIRNGVALSGPCENPFRQLLGIKGVPELEDVPKEGPEDGPRTEHDLEPVYKEASAREVAAVGADPHSEAPQRLWYDNHSQGRGQVSKENGTMRPIRNSDTEGGMDRAAFRSALCLL